MSRHPFLAWFPLIFVTTLAMGADGEQRRGPLSGSTETRFFGQAQLWNVFTTGATDPLGEPVEDRWDLYLRRARLGLSGRFGERIDYKIAFAYDNVGKNSFTGSTGAPQDRDNAELRLWDAYFTWAADPTWLNVTMGYFRPQVGRESITAAVQVDSFTKALTNTYPREHIVDSGPGRETGINVGGLYHPGKWGFHYNVGIFDADHDEIAGKPGGTAWSPLLAGRISFTLGDPEMPAYGLGYKVNYFGARNGTTLSFNYSRQGETDGFDRNRLTGLDILSNYGDLNLSAEYDWLERQIGAVSYTNEVYFVRCGYNIGLKSERVLEPVVMFSRFEGDEDLVDSPFGFQEITQVGLNWYGMGNQLKVNLAYTWQDDDVGRGDFAGLGVQILY